MQLIHGDITAAHVDVIVNASNGIGYMGGQVGKFIRLSGVAESIHYITKGAVEKEAKKVCKKNRFLPRILCGHKPGEVFVTGSGLLECKCIIHAVTMHYPGLSSSMKTVERLLPNILLAAQELKAKSIALPILGAGTGRLSKSEVLELYAAFFIDVVEIDVYIYDL